MKVVKYVDHPLYKITIFKSGFKHIVKFDRGDIEFSFKFLDGEVANLSELTAIVNRKLIPSADEHFEQLRDRKRSVLQLNDPSTETSGFPDII